MGFFFPLLSFGIHVEVLNSPLGLTLLEVFFSSVLYPVSLSLAVEDGGWDQGLASLFCLNLSALLFFHWEQCKRFQVEVWLGFLFG